MYKWNIFFPEKIFVYLRITQTRAGHKWTITEYSEVSSARLYEDFTQFIHSKTGHSSLWEDFAWLFRHLIEAGIQERHFKPIVIWESNVQYFNARTNKTCFI